MNQHGGKRDGSGRPSIENRYNEKVTRTQVSLTDSQKAHLTQQYGGIAQGVRTLVDLDLAISPAIQPKSDGERIANYMKRLINLAILGEEYGLSLNDIESLITGTKGLG